MANDGRVVYCEYQFLVKLITEYYHINPQNNESVKIIFNIIDFLNRTHIYLDKSYEFLCKVIDEDKEGNSLLFYNWKKGCGISCKDDHECEYVEQLTKKYVEQQKGKCPECSNMVYLLDKNVAECDHYLKKYGIITLSPYCWSENEKAQKYAYLFRDCGYSIEKGEYFEWSNIFPKKYNLEYSNAMVIIDNYIGNNIDENLLQILECLLPTTLSKDIQFHLTIIITINTSKTKEIRESENEKLYNQIDKCIRKKKKDLDYRLELYVKEGTSSQGFHDRTILTNNVMISSGAGFNLQTTKKKESQHSSQITIVHYGLQNFSDSADIHYSNILKQAKVFVDDMTNEKCTDIKVYFPQGEKCQNRLLLKSER